MEIPVCPTCGGSAWSSVEEYAGGSRDYELRANGWTLVDSSLELLETNYCCGTVATTPPATKATANSLSSSTTSIPPTRTTSRPIDRVRTSRCGSGSATVRECDLQRARN